jgi:transposase-like protein
VDRRDSLRLGLTFKLDACRVSSMNQRHDPEARRALLALLAKGEASLGEVAALAGVSLQTAWYWCDKAGVDWKRMRDAKLGKAWRRELHNGPRLVETAKAGTGRSRRG